MAVTDNPDRAVRSSTGETRPVLWHSHGKPEPGPPRSCNATPHASLWAYSGPYLAPRRTPDRGQTSPHPLPQPAVGVVVSEPFLDDRRGPKTHPRRTG